MQNAISHAQLNVLGRITAMLSSAVDLIGTCACAQEVQFKWILVADLGFFGNVSTPVAFEMHHSRRVWALLRQVKTECEFPKHDCLMHVGMVVFKAFDDGTRMRTRQQSSLLDKK